MAALSWPPKDPDEILDYELDWSHRILNDNIQSSDWSVPSGITETNSTFANSTTTIWLSGGTIGETYVVTNTVQTFGGRTMQQSVKLKVLSR